MILQLPSSFMVTEILLEQVLINLLDNAIKYTPEDGKVEISVTEETKQEILFSVRDDGIGIPREDLSRIFERFYRVDKGRSQEMGGTGLGLSIVKHIVQAHQGRVWAESQLGKGSTFYFTLPKASPRPLIRYRSLKASLTRSRSDSAIWTTKIDSFASSMAEP